MMNTTILKKNILFIIVGFILAFGLVYLLKNTNLLQASILSLSDYNTIKENNRDMGYKTENNHIEVFCSDTLPTPKKEIIISLLHSDNISLHWNKAEYQNSIHIQNKPKQNETIISVNNINQIDCKESIIDIPFTGPYEDIIINRISSDKKLMKIGNLNNPEESHGS